jgi:hypothetical protein
LFVVQLRHRRWGLIQRLPFFRLLLFPVSFVVQALRDEAVGTARIAKETGLTRQTIYRIKDDPASAEAALAAWGL